MHGLKPACDEKRDLCAISHQRKLADGQHGHRIFKPPTA